MASGKWTEKFLVHVIENMARKLDCSQVAEGLRMPLSVFTLCSSVKWSSVKCRDQGMAS